MSKKKFNDIMSYFNEEEEEEDEEEEMSYYEKNKYKGKEERKMKLGSSLKRRISPLEINNNQEENSSINSEGQNDIDKEEEIKKSIYKNTNYEENQKENINNNLNELSISSNYSFRQEIPKLNNINNFKASKGEVLEEFVQNLNYSKRESERLNLLMNNDNDDLFNNNDINKSNINNFSEILNTKIENKNSTAILNENTNYNNMQVPQISLIRQTFKNEFNNNIYEENENHKNDLMKYNINNTNNNINDIKDKQYNDEEDFENKFLEKLEKERKEKEKQQQTNQIMNNLENEQNLEKEEKENDLLNFHNNYFGKNKNIEEQKEEENKGFLELDKEKDRIRLEKEKENGIFNKKQKEEKHKNREDLDNEKKKLDLLKELEKNQEKLRQILLIKNQNKKKQNYNIVKEEQKDEEYLNDIMNEQQINFINFKSIGNSTFNNNKENILINLENSKKEDLHNFNNYNNLSEYDTYKNNNNTYFNQINSNNLDQYLLPTLYNKDNNNGKKINKKNNIKKNSIKSSKSLYIYNFNKSKTPLKTTQEKNGKKFDNECRSKSFDSKQFKVNNSSYKFNFERNEKLIKKIIKYYCEPNNKLSIIGIAKVLTELKIFRELLNIKNNNIKEIDLKKLRYIVNKIKEGERKKEEMEFLEQIWFMLNPNNNVYINKDNFEGFLKLLFSYSAHLNSKKDIVSYIKDYLNIVHFIEPKNKDNNLSNEEECYYSPLRDKIFIKKDIWPLEKLIKVFMKLKQNLIAYERLNNGYKQIFNDFKEKKIKLKKNNKNKNINSNFDRLYKIYMNKKEIREKTLEKIREMKEKEKLSKYTYKPKITNKTNRNQIKDNTPIYEKLYMRRNDKENTISKLKEKYQDEKIKKEREINNLSFKPQKFSDNNNIKTKFLNNKQPKGSQKYIKRNLSFIKKKEENKKREEDKYTGSNYEKIMRMNFQLPKIKYFEKEKNNDDKEDINHKSENSINSNEEDFYIDIKIPNGKIIKLKVNANEDINKKIIEFCKIYGLNENIKQKLIKKVEKYKDYYICHNKSQEEDDEEEDE